jgi:hypothetical protein
MEVIAVNVKEFVFFYQRIKLVVLRYLYVINQTLELSIDEEEEARVQG